MKNKKRLKPKEKINPSKERKEYDEKRKKLAERMSFLQKDVEELNKQILLPETDNRKYGLPKSIRVLGKEWKIQLVRGLVNPDGEKLYGFCTFNDRTISLCSRNTKLSETLFHEIHHGLCFELGIGEENKRFDEVLTRVISKTWHSIFIQLLESMKGGKENV